MISTLIFITYDYTNGQQLVPQSINSIGASYQNINGSISFIVGELVIGSYGDSAISLGQGFNQSNITITKIEEPTIKNISINIFPNPTAETIFIKIDNKPVKHILLELFDVTGRKLFNDKYNIDNNVIALDISKYHNGIYLLHLKKINGSIISTYKIQKHN